jgi:hypothetical protein
LWAQNTSRCVNTRHPCRSRCKRPVHFSASQLVEGQLKSRAGSAVLSPPHAANSALSAARKPDRSRHSGRDRGDKNPIGSAARDAGRLEPSAISPSVEHAAPCGSCTAINLTQKWRESQINNLQWDKVHCTHLRNAEHDGVAFWGHATPPGCAMGQPLSFARS